MLWAIVGVLIVTTLGIYESHPVQGRLLLVIAGLIAIGRTLVAVTKWIWAHEKTRKPAGVIAGALVLLLVYFVKDPAGVWDWITTLINGRDR